MKSGWVTKKLGEVCEVVLGGTPRTSVPEYWGGSVPWLTPGDMGKIQGLYVDKTTRTLTQKGLENGSSLFPANSVVLSTRAPIGYVLINTVPMCTNQGCKTIVPGSAIMPNFLAYNLIGRAIELNELGTGTTFKELATGVLKNIDIPIPPLAEQKRIVAKIDAAFEKIDALKANAEKNLANAKELFQSALDEAMRPKKGWVEKRLGEIGSVCMCKRILKSETNTERGVPFYKIGTFGKTANAYISQETFDRYRKLYKFPRKGEILISAAGTIGRAVTYDGAPAYFQDSNIVWVANDEKEVLNQYLKWFYATSPWHVTKGATIQRLYNDNIESVQIAYPNISTQKRICQTLEISSQKIDTLQQNYAQQIADCAEMRQAILMEVFEGRL